MKIVNLEQNTDEWLLYRQDKIGASDFCSFMDSCVGNTANKIMSVINGVHDKKYTSVKDNAFMKRGKVMEPLIKHWIDTHCQDITYGEKIQSIMVESDINSRIVASLDGYCDFFGKQAIFEIKTTKIVDKLKQSNLMQKYLYQLVHQYYVAYGDKSDCELYLVMCIKPDIYSEEPAKIDMLQLYHKQYNKFLLEYMQSSNVLSWELDITYSEWIKVCNLYLQAIDNKCDIEIITDFIDRWGFI